MKAVLLTRSPEAPGNRRLGEAARARGGRLAMVDTLAALAVLSTGELRVDGRRLEDVEAVLPRYGPELQPAGLIVQRALEAAGAASLAPAEAFARARDKAASLASFRAAGLAVPETAVVCDPAQAEEAVEAAGGGAVVVKPALGWRGAGLRLFIEPAEAASHLRAEADARSPLLVQRHVAEASARSLRLLIVDGELVAAVRLEAPRGDFRANLARGASASAWREEASTVRLAVAATTALGLRAAGVDLLEARDGPVLLEANAAPGFAALERVTGVDAAGALWDALAKSVS